MANVITGDDGWTAAKDKSLPEAQSFGLTEQMLKRAVLSEGNTARLARVMKKARNGEEVVIGTIGGSITQGSLASSNTESYAHLSLMWWLKAFPDNKRFDFVNAGIGATNSYIGVHRVEQHLLSKNPDIVIVEFSVNDDESNKNSYESLVRKILDSENDPAVILLFTTQEDGTSMQDVHSEIGRSYDLPMLSYKNAILPAIDEGVFKWSDISLDHIHPNTKGHGIIGKIIWEYLNSVYEKIDTSDIEIKPISEALTGDIYRDAQIYDASNITPTEMTGFTEANLFSHFPDDWNTVDGGTLKFEVEAKNIGVMYYRTIDGLSGQYTVYIDGEAAQTLNGNFSGGWGNYAEAAEVYTSDKKEKHIVEIKSATGSLQTKFTVLGLLIS